MPVAYASLVSRLPKADSPGDASTTWVWLSLIPMGLGAWAPIYAGLRATRRLWWLLGVISTVIALAGWVAAIASNGGAAGGLLIILGWAGGAATSFAIRSEYRRVMGTVGSPLDTAMLGARRRLAGRPNGSTQARRGRRLWTLRAGPTVSHPGVDLRGDHGGYHRGPTRQRVADGPP